LKLMLISVYFDFKGEKAYLFVVNFSFFIHN
jgi:hypothetical protein